MNEQEIENYLKKNKLLKSDVVRAVQEAFPLCSKRYLDTAVRDMIKGKLYLPVYAAFIESYYPGLKISRPPWLQKARDRRALHAA